MSTNLNLFFAHEVKYMGHPISKDGVKANVKELDATHPKNAKEVHSFLGGINYYSKYVLNMLQSCTIIRLIHDPLK